jgi:uncharacterized protein related to proFAR isomerase
MDRKQKQQGKRKVGEPTIDQFHTLLQQLCPENQNVEFTEKAVAGLRQVYIAHLQQVASSLTQWDSLKDEQKVVNALASIHHSDVAEPKWIQQAQNLLSSQQTKRPAKVQRKRRPAITAEMQAEQERLLKKSKQTVMDQQQKK